MIRTAVSVLALAGLAGTALAQPTLAPLSSFGSNGWRAPSVILAGDSPTSNDGTNYLALGTGNLERGLAFNPSTGNLILVTRNGAITGQASPVRVLSGTSGRDLGGMPLGTGVVAGGAFVYNKVGVADDGAIYMSNMVADARTGAGNTFKVYRWSDEAATAPTTVFNGNLGTGASTGVRVGDSLDISGSGANTRMVFGHQTAAGYTVLTGDTSPTAATYVGGTTPSGSLPITGTGNNQFRLGITFAGPGNDVWGRAPSQPVFRSTFSALNAAVNSSFATTSAGEAAMDYITINGTSYLALLDTNNSRVRIYDVTGPAAVELTNLSTTIGTLTGNGNATGDVRFGAVTLDQNGFAKVSIYAMSTNQGIQAFEFFTIPTPGAAGVLAMGGLLAARRRRR